MVLSFGFLNVKVLCCICVALFQHHFATSNPTGLTLRAVLDDSPRSPLYRIENLTETERIGRLISITNARVNYLNQTLSLDASVDSVNTRIPLLKENLYYAVEFTIGSQKNRVKLLMDTAGGLTWTQCQPCKNCFPQKLPIFNPTQSTTYRTLPCDHPLCQGTGRRFKCEDGHRCTYNERYGGGATTNGVASLETFHFPSASFENIIYGCSSESRVTFQNTDISGIFGLSMAPESMTTQFSPSKFSYCMAPFLVAIPRPLVLRFGEDVPVLPPQQSQITAFATVPGIPYFYLQLIDISVANVRLGLPKKTFQIRQGQSGGCFIDSGALYTVIDSGAPGANAYQAALQMFAAYYRERKLKRTEGNFEYCYEIPKGYKDFASLTFHFNGADYTVKGQYVNSFSSGSFCIAILRGNVATILGAWQQQDKRIIYDLGTKRLQFADEQCINDVP